MNHLDNEPLAKSFNLEALLFGILYAISTNAGILVRSLAVSGMPDEGTSTVQYVPLFLFSRHRHI
jgi:hypothetical protein